VTKSRLIFLVLTILVVGLLGAAGSMYARGYRFNFKTFKFSPSGLLVLKSEPTGAQIFINGDLKSATDATISLSPDTYDVSVRKDGYLSWNKRLVIEKEVVTEAQISLFRSAPSLTPITFSGSISPVPSDDLSRIAYAVPNSKEATEAGKVGLWVIETADLPLGFTRDPRKIADGDYSLASWEFSPDGRQLLLTTKTGNYLIDAGAFTSQNAMTNVASRREAILKDWETQRKNKLSAQIKNLPIEVADILNRKSSGVTFSPDENKILYTASSSASLKQNLILGLPGSSTQPQARNIEIGKTYVYDIKEDRNFKVGDEGQTLHWFPTSNHMVLAEEGKVTVMDYDGTNRQAVYNGSYTAPDAYPYANTSKLLILTNLGSNGSTANLYSLSLK
jgi:hypothetical protein